MSVSPPRPNMPHLNALRAFEAAARLGSISAAAQELFVTPAAVAQHVKSLEAWAGEKLLKRNPQGVELTPLGAGILPEFISAFDELGDAVNKLRTTATPREIRIAALPSVAQHWLSPRLLGIRESLPETSISVTALENCPNLIRDPFDLTLFYQEGTKICDGAVISQDIIFPVCSPQVAARLGSFSDLAREVFLHDSTWRKDWKIWLDEVCPQENLAKSGPEFSLYSLALEECMNGAGVLIGHGDLVSRQINAGTLVAPFEERVFSAKHLVMHIRTPSGADNAVQQVADMLLTAKV